MKNNFSIAFLLFLIVSVAPNGYSQDGKIEYKTKTNIQYYEDAASLKDDYINERCRLDLYYPTNIKNYPTIVWFHGGGLRAGERFVPQQLKEKGFAIAAVNYRLFPKVKCPAYIEDAAASVAWVMKHIEEYGGSPERVFVSGHSAGGYLTSMVGLDKRWLAKHGVDADDLAGLVPFSGHTITHFTVREERGIPSEQPIVDEFAPLYYVRADAPPIVFITGDREMEMLGRYEENAYMARMMKGAGHKATTLYELQGYNHGGMPEGAYPILVRFVKQIISE
ncbi:alpha/beta hydrolase [bacterium]|nr:alpha/beta hydrolase [bacterium]